jgi:membrane dipeptidase
VDERFHVVDLHTHPTLKSYMFKTKFWKAHRPPSGFFPLSMCVDLDSLFDGGVRTFVCATYVVERPMFRDVWPLGTLARIHPRAARIATAPMDMLTREYLDEAESMVEQTRQRRGDVIETARSRADMKRITGEGKICMLHAVEGAHHLNGNIGMVDELFARGVCYMIVPHLYPNEAGGCANIMGMDMRTRLAPGCFSPKYQDASGLSDWGHELVEKLLDVGIIVDPTHGTREYRKQVVEVARNHPKKRPIIMSHVCAPAASRAGHDPVPEDIREIADTGGAIGLMMFYQPELAGRATAGVESTLGAIDYLVQHGGEDVVAMGSDLDGFTTVPKDLRSPRGYRPLREAMLKKYTEKQVEKFLRGNAERVLLEGWGS